MKQKTAMQELIDRLNGLAESVALQDTNDGQVRIRYGTYRRALFEAESFLEKERQQIIDARNNGLDEGSSDNLNFKSGEQYYNETFES